MQTVVQQDTSIWLRAKAKQQMFVLNVVYCAQLVMTQLEFVLLAPLDIYQLQLL